MTQHARYCSGNRLILGLADTLANISHIKNHTRICDDATIYLGMQRTLQLLFYATDHSEVSIARRRHVIALSLLMMGKGNRDITAVFAESMHQSQRSSRQSHAVDVSCSTEILVHTRCSS